MIGSNKRPHVSGNYHRISGGTLKPIAETTSFVDAFWNWLTKPIGPVNPRNNPTVDQSQNVFGEVGEVIQQPSQGPRSRPQRPY